MPLTALIIIASVVFVFWLLFHIKLRAEILYIGGELDLKIKYLFFTLYPMKKKKSKKTKKAKKEKKKKKLKKSAESTAETEDASDGEETDEADGDTEKGKKIKKNKKDKDKKESVSEKIDKLTGYIEKAKIIWGFSAKRLKKIFTHIYLENLMIDFIVASDDAYKTAMNYGTINAAVYNGMSAVRLLFPITVKSVDIVCDFDRKEPVYDCGVSITLRPSVVISAVFGILTGVIINFRKIFGKSSKQTVSETAAQV